ncbi:L,D-transpeptidase [Microbacterium gubbeenense]|uniref:L,D-transpeptidase n=1 Tax=Microbacterium gubbeenense TaxID=159896 RepID=UPI0003FD28A0|nr:L,D-transpeptidase [Microbacterium gubbeenense]
MTKRGIWIGAAIAIAVVVVVIVAYLVWPREAPAAQPAPTPSPAATATPTPTPTPSGPPANDTAYDQGDLPIDDVFLVDAALPVDDDPTGEILPLTASPRDEAGAPVFADPSGEPIAWLPQEQTYGGTDLPVVEMHESWVKVLLAGRQARAGEGDASQVVGWLRVSDAVLTPNDVVVEVDLDAHAIDIVTGDGSDQSRERIADDFAWGTEATPTPVGRTFVMHTEVVPSLAYTRGHPIVYLGAQSSTLAGFDGQDVAVTAFHYHDVRSGAISNGCIRVDADVTSRLAELPVGTPVVIS